MEIKLKNSRKAKKMKISVRPGGIVVVTKPFFIPKFLANRFINDNKKWINETVKKQINIKSLKSNREDYINNKEEARKLICEKVELVNRFYCFKVGKISIKNQATRWGSCSSLGNLSFNWQVAGMPEELTNYIIVHELCHLKEMNHSTRFWYLVAKYVPNYKFLRKRLIKDGINLA